MSAPESGVTAAVMRTARALHDVAAKEGLVSPGGFGIDWDTSDAFVADARTALVAALDVDEMARVLHREGAWCGVCEYDGWDACTECRETVTGYARALRAAILGGAA